MAMYFDNRGINHCVFHIWFITEPVENPFEYISLNPPPETPERAVPVPKLRRQIAPWCVRPDNPKDSFKEKTRIVPSPAGRRCATRTERFNRTPLTIGEYKSALVHSNLPFGSLNQKLDKLGILNVHGP